MRELFIVLYECGTEREPHYHLAILARGPNTKYHVIIDDGRKTEKNHKRLLGVAQQVSYVLNCSVYEQDRVAYFRDGLFGVIR